MVQDIDARLAVPGVAEGTIKLSGINRAVASGTGIHLGEAAVVVTLIDRRRIRADVTAGTVHQGRIGADVTGRAQATGRQHGRMVHFRAAVFHRLGCVTGLAVEVADINRGMAVGTVTRGCRCGGVVHHCAAVLRLVAVAGRTIQFGLINAVTGTTVTGHAGRRLKMVTISQGRCVGTGGMTDVAGIAIH